MRASFEIPKTSLFGMYAMAICERDETARRKCVGQITGTGGGEGIYRAKGGGIDWFFFSSGGRTLPVNGTK
jgi:hypothetical protein